jgi:hypothetical protein
MSVLVEIDDGSDGEYHDLEDAGEVVQDGAEDAAQLLADQTFVIGFGISVKECKFTEIFIWHRP